MFLYQKKERFVIVTYLVNLLVIKEKDWLVSMIAYLINLVLIKDDE